MKTERAAGRNAPEGRKQPSVQPANSPWRMLGLIAGLGFTVLAGIALPVLTGAWIDEKWDCAPAGLLAGLVAGVAAGPAAAWLMLRKYLREL